MRFDVMIAGFPYGGSEHPDVGAWIGGLRVKLVKDAERIGRIEYHHFDDTPITMTRNAAIKTALDRKMDILVMVDSDMSPDFYLDRPLAKPFWDSSFEFLINHQGPCVIAAPYCGPPPEENCYIFHWVKKESEHPNVDLKMSMIPREMAAKCSGMQEVAALPTGLIMIDMRAIAHLSPPWFEYDYADSPYNTQKATTEDVYFTRDCSFAGVKVYSNWDAWAGHWKRKRVGPPTILTPDMVREDCRKAVANNHLKSNQTLLFLKSKVNLNGSGRLDDAARERTRQVPATLVGPGPGDRLGDDGDSISNEPRVSE